MENIDVRLIVTGHGLKHKDIAEKMGISPVWLSVLMRKPLTAENRKRILDAIGELTSEGGHE